MDCNSHSPAFCNDPVLTESNSEVELTKTPQCKAHSSNKQSTPAEEEHITSRAPSKYTPGPTSSLSFPTLSPDGSVEELPPLPSSRFTLTPPAALSSLGAKTKMPENTVEDYDMLDDVSEISNDDRETASIQSTEQRESDDDGLITPEDTGSVVDVEEEADSNIVSITNDSYTFNSILGPDQLTREIEAREANNLPDSYLTEDLETPRQSTVRGTVFDESPIGQAAPDTATAPASDLPSKTEGGPLRILFASERNATDDDIAHICHRVGSLLSKDSRTQIGSAFRMTRLPPTPSGINPSSSLMLRVGEIELIVEHCVGAEVRIASLESYALHIQDADKEHTSVFTVGRGGKVDLSPPDLVIFYLNTPRAYPGWFAIIKDALSAKHVPNMTIGGPGFDVHELSYFAKEEAKDTDTYIDDDDLFDDDDTDLRRGLKHLISSSLVQPGRSSPTTSDVREQSGLMKSLTWQNLRHLLLLSLVMLIGLLMFKDMFSSMFKPPPNPVAELALRREALATSFNQLKNSPDAAKNLHLDFLLPSIFYSEAATQRFGENEMIVSLPKLNYRNSPHIKSTRVYGSEDRDIAYNMTKIIGGVYDFAISSQEAYGVINVDVATARPPLNFTLSHNFGRRVLQRKTYKKTSTDLSNIINKDVALATKRVKTLKERFGLEINAGAAATKNVTSQLVVYMARDLQVFAHTAVSVFGKAAAASNDTAARLKDRIQKDVHTGIDTACRELAHFNKDIQKALVTTAHFTKDLIPSKRSVGRSLAASRERALSLKDSLAGRRKETNSTSATKELSLRVKNIFKPTEKSKRAGSLTDIARCARSKDYLACRQKHRQRAKALKAYKPLNALAKVPEANVNVKESKELRPAMCLGKNCDARRNGGMRKMYKEEKEGRTSPLKEHRRQR